jgi:sporulation protein YlmC with PRC-barrel domain
MEEKLPSVKVPFNYIEKIKEMIIPPMGDGSLV